MSILGVLFRPNGRIGPAGYWTGFAILAIVSSVVAYVSFTRPESSMIAWLISLALIYVYVVVHGKRFHDKGHSAWMALIPFCVSLVVGTVASWTLMGIEYFEIIREAAAALGIDTSDPAALQEAMQSPEFQAALTERVQDPDVALPLLRSGVIPGFLGFWASSLFDGPLGRPWRSGRRQRLWPRPAHAGSFLAALRTCTVTFRSRI